MKNSKTSTNPADALRSQRLWHTAFNTRLALQKASREVHWKDSREQMKPSLKTARARTEVKNFRTNMGFKEWGKKNKLTLQCMYKHKNWLKHLCQQEEKKKASRSKNHWETRTPWSIKLTEKRSLDIAGKEGVFCFFSFVHRNKTLNSWGRGTKHQSRKKCTRYSLILVSTPIYISWCIYPTPWHNSVEIKVDLQLGYS